MATNLLVHHRWRGFLFDGDPTFVAEGQRFFVSPGTRAVPPVVKAAWFTRENVNHVLAEAGVPDEVDVLSLDIDGNDLHLWNAMTMRPRILICEFNNAVPSELRALTIPYQPDFSFAALPAGQALFRSASLAAYVAVSRRRGYRLVGTNALGFNAIFLRDDVLAAELPEIPASALDGNPFVEEMRTRWWPRLAQLPWIKVPADGRLHDNMPQAPRATVAMSPALNPSIAIVVCIPSFRRPQHLRRTLNFARRPARRSPLRRRHHRERCVGDGERAGRQPVP